MFPTPLNSAYDGVRGMGEEEGRGVPIRGILPLWPCRSNKPVTLFTTHLLQYIELDLLMHGVTNVIVARMINRMFLSISVTDTSYHIMTHVLVKTKLYAGIPIFIPCMQRSYSYQTVLQGLTEFKPSMSIMTEVNVYHQLQQHRFLCIHVIKTKQRFCSFLPLLISLHAAVARLFFIYHTYFDHCITFVVF